MAEREQLLSSSSTGGPLLEAERHGVGLSLSGGGFRASLFHLGALRRLNELDVLRQVDTISSVSGGSIMNAFLATALPLPLKGPVADWESTISKPFRAFCSRNIRRKPILEGLWPWKKNSDVLADEYDELLTHGKLIKDLFFPKPLFVFCSTDLAYGVNWVFTAARSGDYQAGYKLPTPADWKLSTAVAASSCFPPVFKPMSLHLDPATLVNGKDKTQKRDGIIKGLTLSDGGVYDNLGLEPIWKTHKTVLSSDGGALFGAEGDKSFFWEVNRFISIPENQALAVRRRWLIATFKSTSQNDGMDGSYWGIGSARESYGLPYGYSKKLAMDVIACIRTDLDSFSKAEAAILENHGYWLADAAIEKHVPSLRPNPYPPLQVPHPEWIGEQDVRDALKDSCKRTIWGRG